MPFYQRGSTRIHYEEVGSGFPLLIIPGGGLNSTVSSLQTGSPLRPAARTPSAFWSNFALAEVIFKRMAAKFRLCVNIW